MTADLSRAAVRVLLAAVADWEEHGRCTERTVMARTCLRSSSTVHTHLLRLRLRRAGLVTWDDGKHGTLRPLVRRVPFGVAS